MTNVECSVLRCRQPVAGAWDIGRPGFGLAEAGVCAEHLRRLEGEEQWLLDTDVPLAGSSVILMGDDIAAGRLPVLTGVTLNKRMDDHAPNIGPFSRLSIQITPFGTTDTHTVEVLLTSEGYRLLKESLEYADPGA